MNGGRGAGAFWTWSLAFVVVLVGIGTWSLATPLGQAPDEPAQLARAASVVRGQLLGPTDPSSPFQGDVSVNVRIPAVFAALSTGDISCFQFKPTVPAGCAPKLPSAKTPVIIDTYVGRYPPFYYLLVGAPTRLVVSATGIRVARLVSSLLGAAFIALAVCSLRRCRGAPLLAAGVAVAVTPMTLYLSSVINPTGFETTTAISGWAAAMALRSRRRSEVRGGDVAVLGVSLAAVSLSRSLGPLWFVAIAAALVCFRPEGDGRSLLRRVDVRVWLAVDVLAASTTVVWDIYAHALRTQAGGSVPKGTSELTLIGDLIGRLPLLAEESIGMFGWTDTPSPFLVNAIWGGVLAVLVVLGLSSRSRRRSVLTAGIIVAWVGLIVVSGLVSARSRGIVGQGRDFLGLAVGIPVLAAAAAGDHLLRGPAARRLTRTVLRFVVAAQLIDFYWALHRNVVGSRGPFDLWTPVKGKWVPPAPVAVLLAVFAVAVAAYAVIVFRTTLDGADPAQAEMVGDIVVPGLRTETAPVPAALADPSLH